MSDGKQEVSSRERYAAGDEFRAMYWDRVLGPAFREGSRRLCEDMERAILEYAVREHRWAQLRRAAE